MITLESKISVPSDVLFHEVAGEAVILNLETGKYFGLDEIGTRIWSLLTEHGYLAQAYSALLEEYDVSEDRLKGDLLKLVDDLTDRGLLKVDES